MVVPGDEAAIMKWKRHAILTVGVVALFFDDFRIHHSHGLTIKAAYDQSFGNADLRCGKTLIQRGLEEELDDDDNHCSIICCATFLPPSDNAALH